MARTATPEDKFSFGLWTIGWEARDQFGDATRPALDPVESVHQLAKLGVAHVTFHDDDVVPFGSDAASRDAILARFKGALDETGITAMQLKAGEMSLHHTLCPHRSAPNAASHRRVGYGISYIPAHVRTTSLRRQSALLVRDEARWAVQRRPARYAADAPRTLLQRPGTAQS